MYEQISIDEELQKIISGILLIHPPALQPVGFKRNVATLDALALFHPLISDALIAESDFATNTEGQPSSVPNVHEALKCRLLFGAFQHLVRGLFVECIAKGTFHHCCERM